jgi:hypothetical protein
MKKPLIKLIVLTLCYLISASCKDQNDTSSTTPLASEFSEYINRFVTEANKRNVKVTVSTLQIKFDSSIGSLCGYGSPDPPRVSIRKDCWDNYPDIAKEILIFHELGHAILRRPHDDSKLGNGDYSTIMNTGDISVLYNEYTPDKRDYYLDELFGALGELPAWAKAKANEKLIFKDEIVDGRNWRYVISGVASHTGSITDQIFSSPNKSLMINSSANSSGFSYWYYSFAPSDIEEGAEFVAKVKIKASGLTGKGAYFAMRANINEKEYPIFFYTTQSNSMISGSTDFVEYSLTANYFPNKVDQLYIFLLLDGNNQGQVYFDDVALVKRY